MRRGGTGRGQANRQGHSRPKVEKDGKNPDAGLSHQSHGPMPPVVGQWENAALVLRSRIRFLRGWIRSPFGTGKRSILAIQRYISLS